MSLEPPGPPPPPAPREVPSVHRSIGSKIFAVLVLGALILWASAFVAALVLGRFGLEERWLWPVLLLIAFTIAVSFWFAERANRLSSDQIYATGTAAMAVITSSDSSRKSGPLPDLNWAFQIGDRVYQGKRSIAREELKRFEEGNQIWILYDPSNPNKSVAWPRLY